ncbi:universal stress protein [bacterium]|nr:universal stress protein [bacterium]
MYQKILVALDGHPAALAALGPAQALAESFGADLRLVSVEWPRSPRGKEWTLTQTAYMDKKKAELKSYLDAWSAKLRQQGCRVGTCVLPLGSTPERLLQEVENWGADLLVLCSHGREGLSRWMMGSVAEEMNRRAPCSVMIVPSPRRLAKRKSGRALSAVLAPVDPLMGAALL